MPAPLGSPRYTKRSAAISAWLKDPAADPKQIAEVAGCSLKVAKHWNPARPGAISVTDAPRTGRKRKLGEGDFEAAVCMAANPSIHSSKNVAKALLAEKGVEVSASTIRRNFRQHNMIYAYPKVDTALTAKQRRHRVEWAQDMQKGKYNWDRIMMTDSKVFGLHLTVAKKGRREWQPKHERLTEARVRSTQSVHVYVGITVHGATPLLSVTSTGARNRRQFVDPKTGQFHRGVGAQEYSTCVLPWFHKHGRRLFSASNKFAITWHFQQDNARPHTAVVSKKKLQELWGHKRVIEWPANSPDLSPVENFWALLSRKLDGVRGQIDCLEKLEAVLQNLVKKWDRAELVHMLQGMPNRLQKVIELNGARIGK